MRQRQVNAEVFHQLARCVKLYRILPNVGLSSAGMQLRVAQLMSNIMLEASLAQCMYSYSTAACDCKTLNRPSCT